MNRVNADKLFQSEIQEIIASNKKPTLLLHSCCAPCFTGCIERLKDFFSVTVFFYNPNMDTQEEFNLRRNEQMRICSNFGVNYQEIEYNHQEFLDVVTGKENQKEGGTRCQECFTLRLKKTAEYAKKFGFDYFATTLTLSPLKNAEKINEIGLSLQELIGVKYLVSDFKKRGGYTRSIELSKTFNLYRQNFCGCEFSKR